MKTRWTMLLSVAITISLVTVAVGYDWRQKITYGNDPTKRTAARSSAAYSTAVAGSDVESRRAFSYQPLPYKPGDTLQVTAKEAELKIGDRVLATVRQGQRIYVTAVQGPWVGTHIELEGRKIGGWILGSELGLAPNPPKATP